MELFLSVAMGTMTGIATVPLTNAFCLRRGGTKLSPIQAVTVLLTPLLCAILLPINLTLKAQTLAVILVLISLSVTDLKTRKIPNSLLIALVVLKLVALFTGTSPTGWIHSLIGLAAGLILFTLPLLFKSSIGEGDVKLAGVAGFYTGLYGLAIAALVMSMGLLVYGGILTVLKKGSFKSTVPMGPFLSAGLFVALAPIMIGGTL